MSEAARKVWNLQPFKALLSPHEFMQAVNISSLRRYSINSQADATEFMAWLLNALHRDLSTLHQSNLVAKMMQGRVQVSTKKLRHNEIASVMQDGTFESKTVPFFYLTLDLPPIPLYQSSSGEFVVPQVSLERLLEKYDGGQLTQRGDLLQAFALEELPPFLLLHHRRFIKPHLIWEKNRTIVTHPMSGLIIKDGKFPFHYIID